MLSESPSVEVTNNTGQNRFELRLNGDLVGILGYYEFEPARPGSGKTPVVSFMHTVIVEDFGHRGLAGLMVRGALDAARSYGWRVRPVCSYVRRFLDENPGYRELTVPV